MFTKHQTWMGIALVALSVVQGCSDDEGPGGGMTGRGVHVVDAMMSLAGQVESVHAQSYPTKPVRVITPTGPGGSLIASPNAWASTARHCQAAA